MRFLNQGIILLAISAASSVVCKPATGYHGSGIAKCAEGLFNEAVQAVGCSGQEEDLECVCKAKCFMTLAKSNDWASCDAHDYSNSINHINKICACSPPPDSKSATSAISTYHPNYIGMFDGLTLPLPPWAGEVEYDRSAFRFHHGAWWPVVQTTAPPKVETFAGKCYIDGYAWPCTSNPETRPPQSYGHTQINGAWWPCTQTSKAPAVSSSAGKCYGEGDVTWSCPEGIAPPTPTTREACNLNGVDWPCGPATPMPETAPATPSPPFAKCSYSGSWWPCTQTTAPPSVRTSASGTCYGEGFAWACSETTAAPAQTTSDGRCWVSGLAWPCHEPTPVGPQVTEPVLALEVGFCGHVDGQMWPCTQTTAPSRMLSSAGTCYGEGRRWACTKTTAPPVATIGANGRCWVDRLWWPCAHVSAAEETGRPKAGELKV